MDIQFRKVKCPRCKKTFEAPGQSVFVPKVKGRGMMCKGCTMLIWQLNKMQIGLIEEDFSLEQEDERIAKQIDEMLRKEELGETHEDLLPELIDRLIKDQKRNRRLLKKIRALQRRK